jgi:hypothetical protein
MVTIDGFLIDASVTEGHKYTATLTKYPVESGSPIADNVTKEPKQVTIEGIVSDTPIGNAIAARQRTQASPDTTLEFLPSDEALARLEAIFEAEEPVTIETSLKRYENMVLIDLDVPRDAETGDALHFTATFEQVKIITNQRTTIRVASPNNARKSKKSKTPIAKQYGGPKKIFTNSGRALMWNDKKGRYEYAEGFDTQGKMFSKGAEPNGVPASVFETDEAMTAHNTDLAKGIVDPGPGTHYDYRRDEWMHTSDNTPVTQQQLASIRSSPWYK